MMTQSTVHKKHFDPDSVPKWTLQGGSRIPCMGLGTLIIEAPATSHVVPARFGYDHTTLQVVLRQWEKEYNVGQNTITQNYRQALS